MASSQHDLQFTIEGGENNGTAPAAVFSGSMNNGGAPVQQQPVMNAKMASQVFKNSAHPTVCLFHILFKSLALVLYIFGGWFTSDSNFVTLTVFIILLLSADFWVVKNITGRLLVGLRWWNQIEGDTNKWIFESAEHAEQRTNKFDSRWFWMVLYGTPVVWGILGFFCVIKLEMKWLLVVVMAIALSLANVYGYYKCSSDQKVKFQQMMATGAQAGAMSLMRNGLFGILCGQQQAATQPQAGPSTTYV